MNTTIEPRRMTFGEGGLALAFVSIIGAAKAETSASHSMR